MRLYRDHTRTKLRTVRFLVIRKEQSNHPVILNKGHHLLYHRLLYHHTQPNCGCILAVPAGKAFSDRKWRDRISDTSLLFSSSVIKQLRALGYFGHYGIKRQPKTVLDGFVSHTHKYTHTHTHTHTHIYIQVVAKSIRPRNFETHFFKGTPWITQFSLSLATITISHVKFRSHS